MNSTNALPCSEPPSRPDGGMPLHVQGFAHPDQPDHRQTPPAQSPPACDALIEVSVMLTSLAKLGLSATDQMAVGGARPRRCGPRSVSGAGSCGIDQGVPNVEDQGELDESQKE